MGVLESEDDIVLVRLERLRWVSEYSEDPPFTPICKIYSTTPLFINPDHVAAIHDPDPRFTKGQPEHCIVKVYVGGVGHDYQVAGKAEDAAKVCGY